MLTFTEWLNEQQLNELSDELKTSAYGEASDRANKLNNIIYNSDQAAKRLPLSLYHKYKKDAVAPVKRELDKHVGFMHRVINSTLKSKSKPAEQVAA